MTIPPTSERASFEVAKRLLCQILNEGLVSGTLKTVEYGGLYMCLFSNRYITEKPEKYIRVGLQRSAHAGIFARSGQIVSLVRPEMLQMPVILVDGTSERQELRSGALFQFASSLFTEHVEPSTLENITLGLENSRANTEKWLELHSSPEPLDLNSPSVMWERALIWGHPTHPFHRLCYAQEGLAPVEPKDLPQFLAPTLAFLSVLRAEISISGPFEESLQPLLDQLDVPAPENSDRVIVPCLHLQLPCVYRYFPSTVLVKTVSSCADTQASMRTLTLRSQFNFSYHIKLSIACQITSDVRAIRPCQTLGGQLVSRQLHKFFPPDLWWFKETASVSGSQTAQGDTQENEDKARHIGCILREDLEARANANNEALIIAGSLAQQPANDHRTHAEIVFGLETIDQKHDWLKEYVGGFLRAVLPSLVRYGIGMEAHGQNTLVRVCRGTKIIAGFVVRDFEGIKVHVPTLEELGIKLCMTSPGCSRNLEDIWSKIHHSIFQNHLGNLVYALGLDRHDGWAIIRDELSAVLNPDTDSRGRELYDFILQDTMPFKCFLKMRMSEHFNDYDGDAQDQRSAKHDERPLPNTLLMGSARWEKILDDHASKMTDT
ncbi:uncharacterized protein TRUGW13939_01406 [Talaromyces rugulosus]|uniref:Aerobactin siderophore biosynthesis IucA/IucC N-terminal domain-containing protein n=1 Tax=Talaromyces rugulosus TaxID=121627 RepID=A0A7H8QK62_TALRU|nr:uncharacterized protein TRUGW13939_01406 [Talaromyces rugulosus]QKX54320.1 hypothetical protein TRUGW13939_01406 [Talaromyces rugulosus]